MAVEVESTCRALDMRVEVLETVLVLLELPPFSLVKVWLCSLDRAPLVLRHVDLGLFCVCLTACISCLSDCLQLHGTVYDAGQVVFQKRRASSLRKVEAIIDKLLLVVSTVRKEKDMCPSIARSLPVSDHIVLLLLNGSRRVSYLRTCWVRSAPCPWTLPSALLLLTATARPSSRSYD